MFKVFNDIDPAKYNSEVRLPLLVAHVLGPFSWQKRPVRPFQLQLCQLLPVTASISASTRCMWIPVHFGVHFGAHFRFFYQNLGEGKQDGRHGPLESPATAQ